MAEDLRDGVRGALPREKMAPEVRKYRDYIEMKPGAPLYMQEFGFYCLDRWRREEGLDPGADLASLFGFDKPAHCMVGNLGGCEAPFVPEFKEEVLEDRGEHELVRDKAGRQVLYFKGRRSGFMPQYVGHPVRDMKSWEENCLWRMDPGSPERAARLEKAVPPALEAAKKGFVVEQYIVGGYMYLRSLIGGEDLLYKFYDDPKLIHACMEQWLKVADRTMEYYQKHLSYDFLLLDEDVCYNHGPLISPDMIREFLIPYYQQLLTNCLARRLDRTRPIRYHMASDGYVDPVLPLYREAGMGKCSPFERAAGTDVVRTGREYPDLLISGGLDKREMAKGRDAIDRMLESILPVMRERGGYIPTCDHGVPEEVKLDDYIYMRRRMREWA
ncbi:MAG: hypothetical protein K6D94_10605 [Clostridiales bacterium]|nr:hypothetical protein [Clostridiales bacterium]